MIMSTCGVSSSGTSSTSGWPLGSGSATRCALYDGIRSTRNCGRQSKSRQTASRFGRCCVITTAMESMKPRTALTGRPSGAVIDDGTPKNERNHMLAPSSSTSGDRKRGGAGCSGSPLVGSSGDRKRGGAGCGGSPRIGSGAGMRAILPALANARLTWLTWVLADSTPRFMHGGWL
ncbi:Uncharacterised protein [Mycobacterium tuberculosis]|nr:Uncharacterised protein [Mycobacterium tuberculosis]